MTETDPNEELRKMIPFIKNWNTFYALVLGELAVLILLFYAFSKAFE
ncbi:MAG: hypothetical protein SF052_06580 [Bacteroidia bacterium]|nr:hypothetical protein [Bacteroidia bacterium]